MQAFCLVVSSVSLFAGAALAQLSNPPAVLYAGADVVFVGRLEKIGPAPSGLTAQFSVAQLVKGPVKSEKEIQVQVPAQSRCHAFEERHVYLTYGRKVGDQLWVDPCEGSKLASQAEEDLRYIHTQDPTVSEQCSRKRLKELARRSPIVVTAKLVNTEDSTNTNPLLFRPWCGLAWSSEYAYYNVVDVLKGQIPDPKIAVEHAICWDTITVDGYNSTLSPELFREGNVLLLFLKRGSHQTYQAPEPFKAGYFDVDENCGAVLADSDAARGAVEVLRAPE